MAKVRTDEINPREKYYVIGKFFDIVSDLNSKKDAIDFIIGTLTPSEVLMIARRIQVAKMIINGDNYEEIRKQLRVGYHNIASVQRLLKRKNSGYQKQIESQLLKEKNESGKSGNNMKIGLLKRYPQHKFLSELLD